MPSPFGFTVLVNWSSVISRDVISKSSLSKRCMVIKYEELNSERYASSRAFGYPRMLSLYFSSPFL